jgi:deoxyhypusine monooxygenase
MWTVPELEEILQTLRDPSSPIGMRMRAAYYAKQLFVDLQKEEEEEKEDAAMASKKIDRSRKMEAVVKVLCGQVFVEEHGSLLRHEFAYVLGQMKTEQACKTLENLLVKEDDCVMVRHEAAEALGAIASLKSKPVLEMTRSKYEDALVELSDTCLLAANRLNHIEKEANGEAHENSSLVVGCACMLAPYNSIDPVDVDPAHVSLSTAELGDILLNKHNPENSNFHDKDRNYHQRGDLIERYRAMFSLRNRGGEECVQQLCRALVEDTSSPLLRHEVAFVLGQLQYPSSISALEESLSRLDEHAMVRHESAEALGAIEGTSEDWERIESILTKYQKDFDQAVAESCVVALDAADYWGHDKTNDDFQDEEKNIYGDDHGVNIAVEKTGGAFGKQKHDSTVVATCEIRKQILAQHFNVVQSAPM